MKFLLKKYFLKLTFILIDEAKTYFDKLSKPLINMKRKFFASLIPVFIFLLSFNYGNDKYITAIIDGKKVNFDSTCEARIVKYPYNVIFLTIRGWNGKKSNSDFINLDVKWTKQNISAGMYVYDSATFLPQDTSSASSLSAVSMITTDDEHTYYTSIHSVINITSIDSFIVEGIFNSIITSESPTHYSRHTVDGVFKVSITERLDFTKTDYKIQY